jgi:hypothetical protein
MKVQLATMLAAGLLTLGAVSGCSTPAPTPTTAPQATAASSPSASPVVTATPAATATPSASPSAAAAQPKVVCQPYNWVDADPSHLPAVTLTCENAVAAAKVVVGPDLAVVSIEFGWGRWCPPGSACIPFVPNDGWVIFHRSHDLPDLLMSVTADASGKVTAAAPTPLPSPSAS